MKLMGTMGMNLDTSELTVAWRTPVLGLALGIVVTVARRLAARPARGTGLADGGAARRRGCPADSKAGAVRAGLGLALTVAGAGGLCAASRVDESADGSLLLGGGVLLSLLGHRGRRPGAGRILVRVLALVLPAPSAASAGSRSATHCATRAAPVPPAPRS